MDLTELETRPQQPGLHAQPAAQPRPQDAGPSGEMQEALKALTDLCNLNQQLSQVGTVLHGTMAVASSM